MTYPLYDKTVKWILKNCLFFKPIYSLLGGNKSEEPSEQIQTALAELSLLCDIFSKSRYKECNFEINVFTEIIEEVYSDSRFYIFPMSIEPLALNGHLFVWKYLLNRGIKTQVSRETLLKFIETGVVFVLNRESYRELELFYLLSKCGLIQENVNQIRGIFKRTFLGQLINNTKMNPVTFADLYDMTHTLFYITDFGLKPSSLILKKDEILFIKGIFEVFFQQTSEKNNYDLLCELIMAYHFLCNDTDLQKYPNFICEAWEKIRNSVHSVGCVPAIGMDYKTIDTMLLLGLDKDVFIRCYHPTIMASITSLLVFDGIK